MLQKPQKTCHYDFHKYAIFHSKINHTLYCYKITYKTCAYTNYQHFKTLYYKSNVMCNKYAAKFEQNATFYVVKGRILHNISACFTSQNTVFGQKKATFKGPFLPKKHINNHNLSQINSIKTIYKCLFA